MSLSHLPAKLMARDWLENALARIIETDISSRMATILLPVSITPLARSRANLPQAVEPEFRISKGYLLCQEGGKAPDDN